MNNFLISRTDNIGDVILTLPLCGKLKEEFPNCTIIFLGKNYTRVIAEHSIHVDYFIDWDSLKQAKEEHALEIIQSLDISHAFHIFPNKEVAQLLKKAKIPNRIGTSHRWFHWLYCNKRVNFTRKNSDKHESELNFELLRSSFSISSPPLSEMYKYIGWNKSMPLSLEFASLLDPTKKNIILHPLSNKSAREWPLNNYLLLIESLPKDKFKIFVCGVKDEGERMEEFLKKVSSQITNLCGRMDLKTYMSFIQKTDALIACSTGPLHIAAAMGIHAIGIYPPMKPIHPGRWQPIGKNVHVLVENKTCNTCRNTNICACINSIKASQVAEILMKNI